MVASAQPESIDAAVPSLRQDESRRGSVVLPKQKGKNAQPTVRVVATEDPRASEWGSLLSDLTRGRAPAADEVEWRVHDRTHLEFAIDYPFAGDGERAYAWEAFFFVPDSFRLKQTTYDKKQIYDDLLSYVRLAIPEVSFEAIARACGADRCEHESIGNLRSTVRAASSRAEDDDASRLAVRRLRVFSCVVRAAGLSAQRGMLGLLEHGTPEEGVAAIAGFSRVASEISTGYRALISDAEAWSLPTDVSVALKWVDEDLSLFFETLFATASVRMQQQRESKPELASRLAAEAVTEARYRRDRAYPSVGSAKATARDAEHIEFRRHVLKRFTSSVFWLKHEVRDGSTWIRHGLFAFAAAIAMTFAVFATLHATQMRDYFALSFVLLVVSYAVKDRMKAVLQVVVARWADKRFPDRQWTVKDEERSQIGVVEERAGFRDFEALPESVLSVRRATREHALEEHARPETVLWHEKRVVVGSRPTGDLQSPVMTEIFRLNLGPWLAHTDDPNRTITFADPDQAVVCSATARRVYNINVIYRLRARGSESAWKRIRVVVSRKGIERIDPIAR